MLRVRLLVALAEEEELELRAERRVEAHPLRALELGLQNLPRRGRHRRAVVPLDVAEHEHRGLVPGDPPQRLEVRGEAEVAVAALPARERVARNRVHLHLEGEQVVAAFDGRAGVKLLEEELGVEPLPHQPALHVGEGSDHRVDGSRLDLRPQFLDRQHEIDPIAPLKPSGRRS